MARPLIREREADLDRRLLGLQLLQPGLDAFAGPFGRLPFPFAARPSMERLDAAQPLHQLLLGAGGRFAPLVGFRGWAGGACAGLARLGGPGFRSRVGAFAAADQDLERIASRLGKDPPPSPKTLTMEATRGDLIKGLTRSQVQ